MSISLWFIIITFLLLMFAGVPVAFSLGVPCILWGLVVRGGIPITFVAQNIMGYMLSFTLISMPGFLLVGRLMNTCGVTDKLFKFAIAMVGRWRGGLAHANALASMMFASMSGTAVGDAGGLGLVEMKMMKEAGYDPYFAAGITASSSVLGPIIPPSSIMIMLGAVGEVSVASLFYGGIMPGVLMTAALMLNIALRAIFTKEGRTWPKTVIPWKEALKTIPQALPALGTFVIIIGSINGGVCTPTEAAILAVWYALILGICYRKVTFKNFWETLCQTIDACGTFMLIAATASILAWAFRPDGSAAGLRRDLPNPRLLPRHGRRRAAHRADPDAGHESPGHQPGALRPDHGRRPADRHHHATLRPLPVCGGQRQQPHRQGRHQGSAALFAGNGDRADPDHHLPGDRSLAAADQRSVHQLTRPADLLIAQREFRRTADIRPPGFPV